MKKHLIILQIAILALISLTARAQSNRLYTIQDGMVTCDINSLTLDQRGLMWIAGSSQICYFGGIQFHYVDNRHKESGKTLFNSVRQIVEDKDECYWIISDGGLFHFNSRNLEYTRITLSPNESEAFFYPARQMLDLREDGSQKLVLTDGYGAYVLDNATHKINTQETAIIQDLVEESFLTAGLADSKGNIWLGRISRSLARIDFKTRKLKDVNMTPEASSIVSNYYINKILEVPDRGAVYFATDGGILKFDYHKELLTLITGNQHFPFTALLETHDGMIMAGSDSHGLWTIDHQDKVMPYKLTEPFFDLSMAKVKDIVMDQQGNIMIALLQKGIYVIPNRSGDCRYYPLSLSGNGRNTSCITSIQIDEDSRYWIATDGAGVFTADPGKLETAHPLNTGLNSLQVQDIVIDKRGTVWAGSYGGGLQYHTPGSQGFNTPLWTEPLRGAQVMALSYDPELDYIFVATNGMGVTLVDLKNQTCKELEYDENRMAWIADTHLDKDGTLWICEVNNVFYYNCRTGQKGMVPKKLLPTPPVCVISYGQGKDKEVYIGTHEGLLIYNQETGQGKTVMRGMKVMSIKANEDDIWATTPNAIHAIDRKTLQSTIFTHFGGFFLGEFHKHAAMLCPKGELLWGCDNGILSFYPQDITKPHKLHNKVLLTSFVNEGRRITYLTDPDKLDANILSATKINLNHNNSTFSLTFGIPDFGESPNTTYECMLEGYDKEWNIADGGRARYSMLPHGTYLLRARACIDGTPDPDTERTITIYVAAPWWATWWARLAYAILFLLVAYALWSTNKSRRKRAMELEQAHRNEELNEAKLNLFTSITHELRAPLTMIVTPLKYLMSNTQDETLRNNLQIMQQNCNRLLNTVRQITDIRKIDAGQFDLHFEEVDICQYSREVTQYFMGTAMVKRIKFSLENSHDEIPVWVDPIHFEKVLVNLLSNAFKFTGDEGHISLRNELKENELQITVYNEGPHIGEKDITRLYERFFQSSRGKQEVGTGIGLNLCYELMQLHHGSIEARNTDHPFGVEFVLHLPLGKAHLSEEELSPSPERKEPALEAGEQEMPVLETEGTDETVDNTAMTTTEAAPETPESNEPTQETTNAPAPVRTTEKPLTESTKSMPRVLMVDDDRELCEYVAEQLKSSYNVTVAYGGNSAWNMVMQNRPDIVITDFMMPDGNGIELAKRIKTHPELDNIPIIMVTGEDDESLQLESLKLNVDHYMQKPFNVTILKEAINQALRVRENTRKHTKRTDTGYDYTKMEIESAEENLYQRINKTLQAHLDDSEYGVQDLSEDVGISRVHLNRKMKERYGLSPNAFIKSFRLKQAAYLLVNNNVNVSEVAYRVGFTTHSHFTSSFRDFFSMAPKEFVAFYSKEENKDALRKLLE